MRVTSANERVDLAIAELAQGQRGLFTHDQAMEHGWAQQRIDRRRAAGRIRRLHHRVYAFAGSPDTWERAVLAAVFAAGAGAAACHDAAAALHGFPYVAPRGRAKVVVGVPARRHPRPTGVTVHRMLLPAHHLTRVDGLPTTTYERTLVDMTGRLSLGQLARVLDTGLVAGAVELASLHRMLAELGPAPGRRLRPVRVLLDERGVETQRAESGAEIRVLRALRDAGLPIPTPQHEVVVFGEEFRLDAAYVAEKIGLEYQGWDPHRTRSAFDQDFRRDRLLSIDGWTVLYFTSASTDAAIVRDVARLLDRHRIPGPDVRTCA